MATENEYTDKIFSSDVPKVKPGIKLIYVNRETTGGYIIHSHWLTVHSFKM